MTLETMHRGCDVEIYFFTGFVGVEQEAFGDTSLPNGVTRTQVHAAAVEEEFFHLLISIIAWGALGVASLRCLGFIVHP